MPWVRRHRRRVPGGWVRTTTVRSHYRRSPGRYWVPVVPIVILVLLILVLIAIF